MENRETIPNKMKALVLLSVLLAGFMARISDAADPSDIQCPDEWELVHRGCYKFVSTGTTWAEANDNCKGSHGELASIQSYSEKEELEKRINEKYGPIQKWWVGFERDEKEKAKWNWLAGVPVDSQVTQWTNYRLMRRPGNMCGMIEMTRGDLKVAVTRCSSSQPFICEYHVITERPEATPAMTAPPTPPTTTASDTIHYSNDKVEESDSNLGTAERSGAYPSSQDASMPCGPVSAADSGLYQKYLQSQIEANKAKVAYYAEVSKVYEEALAAQTRYYASHQAMVDLQTEQIRQGKVCK